MEAGLREILPDGGGKMGFRGKAMFLGGALIVSIAASALLCVALLPSDRTELAAESAGGAAGAKLALRLAEGRVSDTERAKIAGGRVKLARKHLADERGPEHRALRLAEGRLSAAEREAEARGAMQDSPRVASVEEEGVEPRARLSHGGVGGAAHHRRGVRQRKAEALAEGAFSGEQPREVEEPVRRGVLQSKAERLAEGMLSDQEREAIAAGTDATVIGGEEGETAHAHRAVRQEVGGGDEDEALRLAEGDNAAPKELSAEEAPAPQRRAKLSDLSVEERGRRVQRLLDVAAKIAAKKFKAPSQQLAQDDDSMMMAPKAAQRSALAERAEDKLVDRVDAEQSGSIEDAGIRPAQWRKVSKRVLQPRAASRHNVATAMEGIDSLALGAQQSMSDVRVPQDQAVRRGWGGL